MSQEEQNAGCGPHSQQVCAAPPPPSPLPVSAEDAPRPERKHPPQAATRCSPRPPPRPRRKRGGCGRVTPAVWAWGSARPSRPKPGTLQNTWALLPEAPPTGVPPRCPQQPLTARGHTSLIPNHQVAPGGCCHSGLETALPLLLSHLKGGVQNPGPFSWKVASAAPPQGEST